MKRVFLPSLPPWLSVVPLPTHLSPRSPQDGKSSGEILEAFGEAQQFQEENAEEGKKGNVAGGCARPQKNTEGIGSEEEEEKL